MQSRASDGRNRGPSARRRGHYLERMHGEGFGNPPDGGRVGSKCRRLRGSARALRPARRAGLTVSVQDQAEGVAECRSSRGWTHRPSSRNACARSFVFSKTPRPSTARYRTDPRHLQQPVVPRHLRFADPGALLPLRALGIPAGGRAEKGQSCHHSQHRRGQLADRVIFIGWSSRKVRRSRCWSIRNTSAPRRSCRRSWPEWLLRTPAVSWVPVGRHLDRRLGGGMTVSATVLGKVSTMAMPAALAVSTAGCGSGSTA